MQFKPKVQPKHKLGVLVLLPDKIIDTVLIKAN